MSEIKAAPADKDTLKEMRAIKDRVGLAAFSLDYLIDNGAPSRQVAKYMDEQQNRLTQAVAKITGGNPEDIADKNKRTPEQERILTEIAGKEVLHRWAKFRNSDYTQITEMLFSRYKGTGDKAVDLDTIPDGEQMAIHNIALYYFATHKDLDPMASGGVGEAGKAEIVAYLDKALEIKSNNQRLTLALAVSRAIGVRPATRRTKTKSEGITEVYERALSITDKDYQWALTPYPNTTAYIAPLDAELRKKLVFKNGQISFLDSRASEAEVKKATEKNGIAKDIDIQLLRSILTAAFHNIKSIEGSRIRVHLPPFCRAMGIDMAKGNPYDLFGKINQYRDWIGFTKKGFHSLLTFSEYDAEANDLLLDIPYIIAIIKEINESTIVTLPGGGTYQKNAYSYLVHSTIGNERNKAAVEIVHIILALLHQRGGLSDQQLKKMNAEKRTAKGTRKKAAAPITQAPTEPVVTAHKTYSAIIAEIPMLNDRIANSSANAANTQLKRAFGKAFELLRTKTDAYEYFIDLKIPETTPTVTTLDKPLKITHKGINDKCKPPK